MNEYRRTNDSVHVQVRDAEGHHVTAEVESAAESHSIYFKSDDLALKLTGDALVAMTLLPAMQAGKDLVLKTPASRRLLSSLATVQDIYTAWHPNLYRTAIKEATPAEKESAGQRGVACFFSGGLDSFYTLLKHREEITHLIFIHPFDGLTEDAVLVQRKIEAIREVAAQFGKEAIVVETNFRSFLEPYVPWGVLGHGAMLFTAGHVLADHLSHIYIAAGSTYADFYPTATHPLIDPLWGTGELEFEHDGREANRLEKAALVAESSLALQTLRVCFLNPGGVYNCGKCEKCIRTMLNLKAVGALERCTTFDAPLDSHNVRRITLTSKSKRAKLEKNLKALEQQDADPELTAALRYVLRRFTTEGVRGLMNRTRMRTKQSVADWKKALKRQLKKKSPGLVRAYRRLKGHGRNIA